MISTSFDESTHALGKPNGISADRVEPLSVVNVEMDSLPVIVSCWKLTQEEVDEFNRTKRIWLGVLGCQMPPVFLTAIKPFPEQPKQ